MHDHDYLDVPLRNSQCLASQDAFITLAFRTALTIRIEEAIRRNHLAYLF